MENRLLQQFLVQQVINRLEIILTRLDVPVLFLTVIGHLQIEFLVNSVGDDRS